MNERLSEREASKRRAPSCSLPEKVQGYLTYSTQLEMKAKKSQAGPGRLYSSIRQVANSYVAT